MDYWSLRRENNLLPTDRMGFDLLSTHLTLIIQKQISLKLFQDKEAIKVYASVSWLVSSSIVYTTH